MICDVKDREERKACSTHAPGVILSPQPRAAGRGPQRDSSRWGAPLHVSLAFFRFFRLNVRNKAKPGHPGASGERDAGRGTNAPNEPNLAGWPARGAGGRKSPPGHDGAKQSQFPAEQREGQVVCGKGLMAERTYKEHWKNKANFRAKPGGTGPAGRET